MNGPDVVCPVCTLTVRREISLSDHLETHPKDQVIKALISKCTNLPPPPPLTAAPPSFQYIQSTNALQYPSYTNFYPVVFPFPQTPAFAVPQALYSSNRLTAAGSSGSSGTVTLPITGPSTGSVSSPQPASNAAALPTDLIDSRNVDSGQNREPLNLSEVLELSIESPGTSQHESIIPDPIDEEVEEDEDEQVALGTGSVEDDCDDHGMIGLDLTRDARIKAGPSKKEESDAYDEELSIHQYSPKDNVSVRDIQTDETMPPQGELSEQESLGGDTSSLWGPAAEDVFSELTNHSNSPHPGQLLSDWPHLLAASEVKEDDNSSSVDIPGPSRSPSPCLSSSSGSNFHQVSSSIKIEDMKPVDQWVKVEERDVKEETEESCTEEPEKVLITVMGEESLLVQQSDNRRDQRTCNSCQESFATVRDLRLHCQKVHKSTIYQCSICQIQFHERSDFLTHNKEHSLECMQCGKTFNSRPGLNLHMKRHLGVRPYKCTICDKCFITKQKLEEHFNGHTGMKPHNCKECSKAFKRYSNLIQHRNYVHLKLRKPKPDFICNFCTKIFQSKKSLSWHVETHLKTPHVCPACPQRFIHMSSLTRHIRTMHDRKYISTKPANNIECDQCGGLFSKTSLLAHMRTHTGDKPFQCGICTKCFATKWNLQQHEWTHAGIANRPLKCPQCRKTYTRREDLEAHIRSHKNKKPYTCDFCGQKFARKYNCIRHMREHVLDKKYVCEVCQKAFHRSYYLKEHARVHSMEKPWACHICGKGSSTKSNHNKHLKTHHARESVTPEG